MANPASKNIYIEYALDQKLKISVPSTKTKVHTCGWLLEETIQKLKQVNPTNKQFENIVALQTTDDQFAIDHWLTLPQKSISILKDGIVLKPFYKQESGSKDINGKVSLEDFVVETKLGFGAFSNVYLVRKKDTGMLYALKQIKKGDMNSRKKKIVIRERQALLDITAVQIITLRYSFQTENHFYLVLDFVPFGDLHSLLKKRSLKEIEVRFYLAETMLGLNAIHSQNYIYRDLKPENLLLDIDGHILITDFGLAKKVSTLTDLNYSQCGTLQVIAPEILQPFGYNCSIDYYNLGTLAYELATGKIPVFTEKDRVFLGQNNPEFDTLSVELKDFIKQLLDPNPKARLGATAGLREIAAHPWMAQINLTHLYSRKIKPPLLFDPSSIKYKPRSTVPKNIDETNEKCLKLLESRNLPFFSFYGFGESYLFAKMPEMDKETSLEKKVSKLATASTCNSNSPSVGSTKSIESCDSTKRSSKSDATNEEDCFECFEFEVGNDSITTRFESYTLPAVKSMKFVQLSKKPKQHVGI